VWNPFRRSQPVTEAVTTAMAAPANASRAGFEYGIGPEGLREWSQSVGSATQTDRRSMLQQLYESYLACPWSWAAVNAISRTITAGGLSFDWDTDDGEGDEEQPDKPTEVLACEKLFKFTNKREDIRQLMRSVIADLLVFGDAFIEIVWMAGYPVALYSLDSPSMNLIADPHGDVTSYVQITEFGQRAEFTPNEVIHISLDSPRSGLFGVSPTQAALLPITAWLFAAATLKETFRKGNPTTLHVDHPQSMAEPETNRWLARFMQRNIGPRNIGVPVITRGGATVKELAASKIDEFLHTLDQKRDEILATYGVPPAEATVIESGNLGGGTGESQRKTYLMNTCGPIAALVLEKINYHLVRQGFGIEGWHVKFPEVDMRDSKTIEDIRDMRVRNGSWTLNKYRTEIGEMPVDGGDAAVLVDRQNIVLWRDMGALSTAGVAFKLKGTSLEPGGAPGDEVDPDAPLTLQKSEPPEPPPPPVMLHPPGGAPDPDTEPGGPSGDEPGGESTDRGRALRESYRTRLARALRELPRAG
jgi:HK97 family phage portal protein